MKNFFRSEALADAYRQYRENGGLDHGCALCEAKPLRSFTHWKIIENNFPYDLIAKRHHMIVPIRHVTEADLTEEETSEFRILKRDILQEYEYIFEGTAKVKSIPAHFHLHLIDGKEQVG